MAADSQDADRYSATIAPIEQIDLSFKSAGVVERILAVRGADGRLRDLQVGDKVAKGTELAAVRALDYEQRVRQAQAHVSQAEAQLAQAQANLRLAGADYDRAKTLFESASLVKPQYDQAKSRAESADAAVAAAQAAVAAGTAVADQARLSLSDTVIAAPFTGWITARSVQKGSLVGSAAPGFTLIDSHLVRAVFAVPDVSLTRVRLGQPQTVLLEAVQRTLRGVVTSISPQADPKSRVFLVDVTIDNANEDIRPGMIGTLLFGEDRAAGRRLVVPLAAVVKSSGGPDRFAVFRIRDRGGKTVAETQEILIGQTYGNAIEVTSGLSAGDRIVAMGGSLVRNGQEVRLLQRTP